MSSKKKTTLKVNRIPSGETPDSISPKKTSSPKNKTTKNKKRTSPIKKRTSPIDVVSKINNLEHKIKTNESLIEDLYRKVDENNENIVFFTNEFYSYNGVKNKHSIALRKNIDKIKYDNKKINLKINDLEAENEENEFIIEIWKSTKINDEEKEELEEEYHIEFVRFETNARIIEDEITILQNNYDIYKYYNDIDKFHLKKNMLLDEQKEINDLFYRGYKDKVLKIIN
jgi:hypothetical protein